MPTDDDLMTDDAKLAVALMRSGLAQPDWWIAKEAGVDPDYAVTALARMADAIPPDPDHEWPILRRRDLGTHWYEAVEDSAREA